MSCRASSPLFQVRPVTAYAGVAKQLVHSLKFEGGRAAAKDVALAMSLLTFDGNVIVTHVPTATSRVRRRGYDHARLIARAFASKADLVYMPLLSRVGQGRQVGEKRQTRKQQMQGAFRPIHELSVQGKEILLVDDVLTTGATIEAAASVLRAAGARRVSAVVFAVA